MTLQTPGVFHGTTIVGIRQKNSVAIGGDGQVTFGETVVKHHANKVRKMYHDKILAGFAGSAADAMTLFEKCEEKLEKYQGNLYRAAVELAKDWRSDKVLRRLDALLALSDAERSLIVSGRGDVIEPDDGILAIGSGGPIVLAAARALLRSSKLSAKQIVQEALLITSTICIYTNDDITIEELNCAPKKKKSR